jgi:hypothetical protein
VKRHKTPSFELLQTTKLLIVFLYLHQAPQSISGASAGAKFGKKHLNIKRLEALAVEK